jgi:hypothetical protein
VVFHSSGMSYHDWCVATSLIAIHNAVAACKILREWERAKSLIETAWELIREQDWYWGDVLLGNALPGGQSQTIKFILVSIIYNRGRMFIEMFNEKRIKEQTAPRGSLLMEELHNLLNDAANSFSIAAAAINQETDSLLIQQEQPEDYRRFQEIHLFLVVKAWSWLGYTLSLHHGASSSFVDATYGVARKHYNALCCITSGNDWRASSDFCAPTTVPNKLQSAHAAPSA